MIMISLPCQLHHFKRFCFAVSSWAYQLKFHFFSTTNIFNNLITKFGSLYIVYMSILPQIFDGKSVIYSSLCCLVLLVG